MSQSLPPAPGRPGGQPRWTSAAKSGVGTSAHYDARVWFTISHGILNEIFYPRVDRACTRDMGLLVTDGANFFSEEKRHTQSEARPIADGVPAYQLVNTCVHNRYRVHKTIFSNPHYPVVLQRTRFEALSGSPSDYQLFALLSPHLNNAGFGNNAYLGEYKGVPMLFAKRDSVTLAMACSAPWIKRSCGYVGVSDGWQDISRHKTMTWEYGRADDGNVALTGQIDHAATGGEFVLALAFGRSHEEAGYLARSSLQHDFDTYQAQFVRGWEEWQEKLYVLEPLPEGQRDLYRTSAAVVLTHAAKDISGGLIASLSIPWGFTRQDENLGGYHLIWPRDMVESAAALLAIGQNDHAHRVLHYLQATQEADGHWPQNMWLDGSTYWYGLQMDETAFPILLVDMIRRLSPHPRDRFQFWPMVRKAAQFLVCHGPVTQEDRWEENAGFSPFTLAVEIAGLLVAAELADHNDEPAIAEYLRQTADAWNDSIERWTYVEDTPTAKRIGVKGYYVRLGVPDDGESNDPVSHRRVNVANRPTDASSMFEGQLISPDVLALVRFGLRAADDPRIVNTIKVIDSMLKLETPYGPSWYRYNNDGYGEQEDGSPFITVGIGRAWPLLTGECAHYELAAGRAHEAARLLNTMAAFANEGGLIPEQVWDQADIPERELFFARPSGSAMPLVWAHAEYIKLRRSLQEGRVFDMPMQTLKRYVLGKKGSPHTMWRFNLKCRIMDVGRVLRIEALAAATIRWTADHWTTQAETQTADSGLGIHYADLPTSDLKAGATVEFTFYWPEADRWEGRNFMVHVE